MFKKFTYIPLYKRKKIESFSVIENVPEIQLKPYNRFKKNIIVHKALAITSIN